MIPLLAFLWAAGIFLFTLGAGAAQTVLYATGFERVEGYDAQYELAGQGGWVSEGTGGNGLVAEFFEGYGQQAYVGYFPPTQEGDEVLNVWRPVNVAPLPADKGIVRFTTQMSIIDSRNSRYDDFRWSVYNTNADRLFTLDFDNSSLRIHYLLERSTNFIFTGIQFTNDLRYQLQILMDFQANRWSATLDDVILVTNQLITTRNSPLNLGDVDAVWYLRDAAAPGDNYMLFDDYHLVASDGRTDTPTPTRLLALAQSDESLIRLMGEPNRLYALDYAVDLPEFFSWQTNLTGPSGVLDYLGTNEPGISRFFFRARLLP